MVFDFFTLGMIAVVALSVIVIGRSYFKVMGTGKKNMAALTEVVRAEVSSIGGTLTSFRKSRVSDCPYVSTNMNDDGSMNSVFEVEYSIDGQATKGWVIKTYSRNAMNSYWSQKSGITYKL